MEKATAKQIKEFFEIPTMTEFKTEWTALTEEEKEYFRVEVGKATP